MRGRMASNPPRLWAVNGVLAQVDEEANMPWELTIRSSDNAALGDTATVREKITAAIPGIQFHVEPSGAEQIIAARAIGVEFPDIIRKHMESRPARLKALFEGDAFIMELYGFDNQPVSMFHVDIRGNGNPMPALAALCVPNGWVAIENASRQPLNLADSTAAGWQSFRKYRDGAVSSILKAIRGESA
jgi:hypothetical protein